MMQITDWVWLAFVIGGVAGWAVAVWMMWELQRLREEREGMLSAVAYYRSRFATQQATTMSPPSKQV